MLGGGRAAVLTYTMPVWATIFAAIFGYEKINLSIVISLILGMIGIFFLSIEINIFENLFGFLITLSAGLSWAIERKEQKGNRLLLDQFRHLHRLRHLPAGVSR